MKRAVMCSACKHDHIVQGKITTIGSMPTCDAFWNGIPQKILDSGDHREPIEGDHGIRFDPVDDEAAAWAEMVWGKKP